ncbi:MAG: hypothetical protein ACJ8J0_12005 [Longimicrobiaceae bacterium]
MKERSEREQQFDALERFRAGLPEYDEDDVLADATEAVEAVRKARSAEEATLPSSEVTIEEMGGEAPCQLPRFWDADD